MQQAPTQAHNHRRGVEKEDGEWWGSGLVLGGGSTRVSKNQTDIEKQWHVGLLQRKGVEAAYLHGCFSWLVPGLLFPKPPCSIVCSLLVTCGWDLWL